jgi:hypothetical protein
MNSTVNNIVLAGVPRSGSTLTCLLLNQLPDTVALHEPIQPGLLRNMTAEQKIDYIKGFFDQQRSIIRTTGKGTSKTKGGIITDNSPRESREAGRHEAWDSRELVISKSLPDNFNLVIKQPGLFTGLLARLTGVFPCFATVRNPFSILLSWQTVDMPVRNGHAPAAEDCDVKLKRQLENEPVALTRQLILLSWYFEQIYRYVEKERLIRYEDIILSKGVHLARISPSAIHLKADLESRNSSRIYCHQNAPLLARELLKFDGYFWRFYSEADVAEVLNSLKHCSTAVSGPSPGAA